MVRNLPADAGHPCDAGSIFGSGRSPGGRDGNPLQYPLLGNLWTEVSLAGYSPWNHKYSDTTEHTYEHLSPPKCHIVKILLFVAFSNGLLSLSNQGGNRQSWTPS